MSATDPPGERPAHADVARILVDAVNAARARGLAVLATSSPGVVCTSSHAANRWEPVRKARGLSPVGAAILYVQPEATDVEVAGRVALGVSAAWLMGFEAGVAGELPYARWSGHVGERIIGQGYAYGREFRTIMMSEMCPAHRVRHARGACPLCIAESESTATPYDPHAGRDPGASRARGPVVGALPSKVQP